MATGEHQQDGSAAPARTDAGADGTGATHEATHGELPHGPVHDQRHRDLQLGEAVVGTGRISVARRVTPVLPTLPFTRLQLARIDRALTEYTDSTGLHFSVYLGDLGPDAKARAEELMDSLGAQAPDAVLVAISPGQRLVEVVTGARARQRLPDRGCKLAVMSMVALFESGDLADGITSGLRILAEQTTSP